MTKGGLLKKISQISNKIILGASILFFTNCGGPISSGDEDPWFYDLHDFAEAYGRQDLANYAKHQIWFYRTGVFPLMDYYDYYINDLPTGPNDKDQGSEVIIYKAQLQAKAEEEKTYNSDGSINRTWPLVAIRQVILNDQVTKFPYGSVEEGFFWFVDYQDVGNSGEITSDPYLFGYFDGIYDLNVFKRAPFSGEQLSNSIYYISERPIEQPLQMPQNLLDSNNPLDPNK